ncbi:transcription-repair coupling factor [Prosthecomicrobium hirschii]|uniref:transcription-repair coupling factor n=1 Tax=Prosthecodimorpha hirschii TaxID=665126 RepID=UPI00112E2FBC|nr:transcription-repair coupling factor [Prosthecomicrobium hirschii]TPQ50523.1 transcription-repair coupling factor [Prosthecomicrobium hirschii]
MKPLKGLFDRTDHVTLASLPDGLEALAIGDLARASGAKDGRPSLVAVARDGNRMAGLEAALGFFAPDIQVMTFPAWDCLPYDRVSPTPEIVARRMATLSRLVRPQATTRPVVLLTTVNAIVQRVPERSMVAAETFAAAPGNRVDMADLVRWLENNGFNRTPTVRETGEYAVRGGILDLFAPGTDSPVRLDFFGDTLESVRKFDAESQRTTGQLKRLEWLPMSEVTIVPETISRFRRAYVARFGATTKDDALYAAISEGRRYAGMEHWLPLFHERLETLFDYLGEATVALEAHVEETLTERLGQIEEHFQARREAQSTPQPGAVPYKPVEPAALYLTAEEWRSRMVDRRTAALTPFAVPDGPTRTVDLGGRQGRSFLTERQAGDVNVFDAVVAHVGELLKAGRRVMIAAWSDGALDRLSQVLGDHGLKDLKPVKTFPELLALPKGAVGVGVLGIEAGVELDDVAVIGEQDILGDRLVRPKKRRAKGSDFLTEVSGLSEGDIVVHVDHGIGRFTGLKTITAVGAPHDCLELVYQGGDKLYLPVENIELLTRYGSDDTEVQLDKLGGVAWQARKARMKSRIREIADSLIKTAAARLMKPAPVLTPVEGLADEFAARFPYEETDDQLASIEAVHEDLAAGRPMDRLVCGDVGFGKTEVALRAAFTVAGSGKQVAVVVPTTLLARQHFRTFSERFKGLPFRVGQLSRLVSAKDADLTRQELESGHCDIVVGTHAILAKSVKFRDLGLLIVDEEQHFGVKHKERLKELKADVHVLTLTATPIPRTLQLALTGVRELSVIATPPIDRLAVRSFVSPYDPLVIREALLREHYRGGQSFYVVPRVSDLAARATFLAEHVPEVRVCTAHGQMAAGELEDVMNAFYEGKYDVLLSTTIVESGLDIPTANTLIIHRADMFGLAQLYQLRGRVGRSKLRAYALFTVPADRPLTQQAERRLKVLQSLDSLGAGFQLASHDLDIRGAGNLLGDEQSGHIKEVGYELYQQMLEEAVASLKSGEPDAVAEEQWSPSITVGTPVLIPETYVADLQLRLGLYRRLADLETTEQIDAFGAEMIDRFGPLPEEVEHLLKIVFIKGLCRRAHVDKIDVGPKGVVVSFRENKFANGAGLVRWIGEQGSLAKIRPDQKIVLSRDWPEAEQRLKGAAVVLTQLVRIAEGKDVPVPAAQKGKPAPAAGAPADPKRLNLKPTPPPAPPPVVPRGRFPSLSSIGKGKRGR